MFLRSLQGFWKAACALRAKAGSGRAVTAEAFGTDQEHHGRRKYAFTREKIAVFAPIPSARERATTSVKPGRLTPLISYLRKRSRCHRTTVSACTRSIIFD